MQNGREFCGDSVQAQRATHVRPLRLRRGYEPFAASTSSASGVTTSCVSNVFAAV